MGQVGTAYGLAFLAALLVILVIAITIVLILEEIDDTNRDRWPLNWFPFTKFHDASWWQLVRIPGGAAIVFGFIAFFIASLDSTQMEKFRKQQAKKKNR
jgi:uncharacterized membrane protein